MADSASVAHCRLSTVGRVVFSSWSRLVRLLTVTTLTEDDAEDNQSKEDDCTNDFASESSRVDLLVSSCATANGSVGTRSARDAVGGRCRRTGSWWSCRFDA